MKISVKFLIIFILFPFGVFSIEHNITINQKGDIEAGTPFRVDLEILNNSKVTIEIAEKNDAVRYREAGRSTSFSIINGVQSLSVIHSFIVTINEAGEFQIGPFKLTDRNTSIISDSVKVNIVNSRSQAAGRETGKTPEYFLSIELSKNEAYVNEYIDVDIIFYTSVEIRFNSYKPLVFPDNTWIENIKHGEDYRGRVSINNRIYDRYLIESKRIFINSPGKFLIEPAVLDFYVFTRSSMFSFYSTPVSLKSEPSDIYVKKLPEYNNKGSNFPVGTYNIEYEINKTEILENTPVTLKITLDGAGAFHSISNIPITFNSPVNIFSSKNEIIRINNQPKKKVWDLILIPSSPGVTEIKFDDFIYFNSETGGYAVIKPESIILDVKRDPQRVQKTEVSRNVSDNLLFGTSLPVQEKEFFISTNLGDIKKRDYIRTNFKLLIYFYATIFIVLAGYLVHLKIGGFSFKFKKRSDLDNLIFTANKISVIKNSAESELLADELYNSIVKFISSKAGISSSDFVVSDVFNKIGDDKFTNDEKEILRDILKELDLMRFSGKNIDSDTLSSISDKLINSFGGKK